MVFWCTKVKYDHQEPKYESVALFCQSSGQVVLGGSWVHIKRARVGGLACTLVCMRNTAILLLDSPVTSHGRFPVGEP